GFLYCGDFRSTALTTLKIAVLSPMPRASVRTATAVNPGDFRSCRRANFRSVMSFSSESFNGIDMCGATCRNLTCRKSNERQQDCGRGKGKRVSRRHAEKHAGKKPCYDKSSRQANRQPDNNERHSLSQEKSRDIAPLSTQRNANSNFSRALSNGVCNHTIKANCPKEQRHRAGCAKHDQGKRNPCHGLLVEVIERVHARERQIAVDAPDCLTTLPHKAFGAGERTAHCEGHVPLDAEWLAPKVRL